MVIAGGACMLTEHRLVHYCFLYDCLFRLWNLPSCHFDTLGTGMYPASTLLILNCVLCRQRARWTAAQGTMAQIGIRADLLFLFVVLLGFVISPLKSLQNCYSWLPCIQRCCSNRPGSSGEIQRWWWYKYKCGGRRNTEVVAIQIQMWWQQRWNLSLPSLPAAV